MKWEEVRECYPAQYVKLDIVDFYFEEDKKIVTEVAVLDVIENPQIATKELLQSKGNTLVYHTNSEKIIIEMRKLTKFRCI